MPTGTVVLRHAGGVALWSLVAALLGVFASLFVSTAEPKLLAVQAAAGLNVTVAVAACGAALLSRRGHLARLAATVAALWIAFGVSAVLSDWHARGQQGEPIVVLSANLLYTNPDPAKAAAELNAVGADVLVTLETTEQLAGALEAGLGGMRPVAAGDTTETTRAVIWTDLPVLSTTTIDLGTRRLPVAVLEANGRRVTVVGVHTKSPLPRPSALQWQAELAALGAHLDLVSGPVVVAGDFNASTHHAAMRPLLDTFADAATARGHLFVPTWPTDKGPVPLLNLDHVLVRDGAQVGDFSTLRIQGTDHLALRVTVYLPER